MNRSQLYIDIHILQDVPPSNLNRDDNGTPKQAVYGGADRLRVSSQAWKRATRRKFADDLPPEQLGVRTRRLHELLTSQLVERGRSPEDAGALAVAALEQLGISSGKKANESAYLLFAGRRQLSAVADALATVDSASKDAVKEVVDVPALIGSAHTLDVALFGRMVADMTQINVDAAAQVAHALSTHAAATQFDYFTAVDDQQEKDEAGAGMIGTVEFNSATLYRFATVGMEQLVDNLGDRQAAADGVVTFAKAFATSMPTGHQNSFAARTRPGLVAVVVRADQPVNLVSAFETPVRSTRGYMAESQRRLAAHFTDEVALWGDEPELILASYHCDNSDIASELESAFGQSMPFADLTDRLRAAVSPEPTDA